MKKVFLTICVLCIMTACCSCGRKEESTSLYHAPDSYQACVQQNGRLIFPINGSIYYTEMDHPQLQKAADSQKALQYGAYLWDSGSGGIYLAYDNPEEHPGGIVVEKLSDEYTRQQVRILNTRDPLGACRIVVYHDTVYYTKEMPEGSSGFGVSLMKFSLTDEADPELVHVWPDYQYPVSVTYMYRSGQYLMITLPDTDLSEKLWVYDLDAQEMILSGEGTMAGAACYDGMLYYIKDGFICSYDLAGQKEGSDPIAIPGYADGMTLACDKDYLYVNQAPSFYEGNGEEVDSKILVFQYDGTFAGSIDLAESEDAVKANLSTAPEYCTYLCSTDTCIFVGKTGLLDTEGIFYIEKSQLKSENPVISTLYLRTF